MNTTKKNILLFDDQCLICNRAVQFLLKFSRKESFYFASLTSDAAKTILLQQGEKKFKFDSLVFYDGQNIYYKSAAFWKIVRHTPILFVMYPLSLIPRKLQNICYDYVARNRYAWFKPLNECLILDQDKKNLFLD